MEIVVQILMLFIVTGFIVKVSFNSLWYSVIMGVAAAAFTAAAYPWAIQQSKTAIADYLQNAAVMQNIAVLLTIEAAVMFAFTITLLRRLSGDAVKPWLMAVLRWFPGLLLFPVLFFILTKMVFAFPGVDFRTIGYGMAAAVLVLVPALAVLMRQLIPEQELRLEVLLIVMLFVVILGLISTVNGNVTYQAVEQPLDLRAIGFAAAVFVVLFTVGVLTNRLRWRLRK